MKISNIYLIIGILFLFLLPQLSNAQDQEEGWFRCGTDSVYEELVRQNPQVALNRARLNDFVREYIRQNPRSNDDEVYVIPVVFHVLHEYGQENVSNEDIQAAIDQINKDYRKMRSDTASIKAEFKPIAADTKIEFRLARKDPDGNCTMGITRTYSKKTNSGDEAAKMDAASWDNSKYLNVWTVKAMSDNGVAGYSYYPGTADDNMDGIILLYAYISRALTHEAGHYLGLPHPWGSTNSPGEAENCDIDDGIEDTPNTIGHTSCSLNAVTCGSLDNVQNFMDYSYCYRMFTNGQAEVMRATLNSDASHRNNLWTEANRIATGTDDDYVDEECTPIADFNQDRNMICAGATISYNDHTYNTTSVDYRSWNFEGGTPATSSDENPTVVYNEHGTFSTELYVENSVDGNTDRHENNVKVYGKADGYPLPYVEKFESPTFPNIFGNPYNDFYVENYNPVQSDGDGWWAPRTESWMRVSNGYTGKGMRIRNSRAGAKSNKLYLPNIRLDNDTTPIEVSFKAAVAKSGNSNGPDMFRIYYSTTCGDTLHILHSYTTRMITAVWDPVQNYVPAEYEWKTHSFVIPAEKLKGQNFRLVVESANSYGNTVYLDDFSFSYRPVGVEEEHSLGFSAYPNPFVDELYLDAADMEGEYGIDVFDFMGRMVYSGRYAEKLVNLASAFDGEPDGVYFVKVYNKTTCRTVKVVKER